MPNKINSQLPLALSLGAQLGFLIAVPIAGFIILGNFVDNHYKTSPFFLIIGFIVGMAFTIYSVYDLISPFIINKGGEVKNLPDIYDQH